MLAPIVRLTELENALALDQTTLPKTVLLLTIVGRHIVNDANVVNRR